MITFLVILERILGLVLDAYSLAILIYAIMSWVPQARFSKFGQIIGRIVEPLFNIIDRIVPSIAGISFSPMIALLVVYALRWLLTALMNFLFQLLL